jgi:hypothetical protein
MNMKIPFDSPRRLYRFLWPNTINDIDEILLTAYPRPWINLRNENIRINYNENMYVNLHVLIPAFKVYDEENSTDNQ